MPHNHCEHCNHHSGGGFVNGLVLGALAGAVLGLLYAPVPGEKTRKKVKKATEALSEKGQEVWEEASEWVDEAKTTAGPLIKELEKNLAPVLKKARASGKDVQFQVLETIERLVEEVQGK